MSLLKNLTKIKTNLGTHAKLIAVTKNHSVKEINQLIFLGVKNIGESKIQEAKEKKLLVKGNVSWHLIGHLQRNKVKQAVELFDLIHSVDSFKLAQKIDKTAKSQNKKMSILVQINIANDLKKKGINENIVVSFLREISIFKNLKVLGLMAIVPHIDSEITRSFFKKMNFIFKKVKSERILNIEMKYLSMGMSNDYLVAIQEGANMVRIGSALFK